MIRRSSIQNCTHLRLLCCALQIHSFPSWASCSSLVNQNSNGTFPLEFLSAASGKSMLFQMRELRTKVSSAKEDDDKAKEEKSSQSSSTSKVDMEKEMQEFKKKLSQFAKMHAFRTGHRMAEQPTMRKKIGMFFKESAEYFREGKKHIDKMAELKMKSMNFEDQRHPKKEILPRPRPTEFEFTDEQMVILKRILLLYFCVFLIIVAYREYRRYKEGKQVINQEKTIFAQPAIGFDQFVHDYLAAGAVEEIAYYPVENKALALLNNGKESPEQGVHIALSKAFRAHPELFTNRIREAEEEMGIDRNKCTPITINDTTKITNEEEENFNH